ncbi:polymer-forming cytoskeletal protein [Desulfovibrio sp. TomC]|uniref:polymer-forming cytoskeletal protein n=1 Tax=Desulfovibrio sp. TomC TaxID=1562888 RepID=UPI001E590CB8|nr:polymer-forming cytoskeletal protein [Desulfovibrio sp. TomC]
MDTKGVTLIYAIAALVLLAGVSAAIHSQYATTLGTMLEDNRADLATYAAYSGLNYARSQNDAALATLHTAGSTDFSMTNGVSFRLNVGVKDTGAGTYPVTVLGMANPGTSYVSNALMTANITPASSGGTNNSSGKNVNTAKNIKVAGYVEGDVLSETLSIQGGSTIAGSITTTSPTATLTISGGVKVGGTGEFVCSNANITVSGGSDVVNGDLYAQGDVLIDGGATINGNIYAKGSVTINGGSKVWGNIHSLSTVNFMNGSMGTASTKQYIYAADTVTVTGGSTIYVDIHSQANIDLQNITIYGNMYAKSGVTETQWNTHLYGNIYTNPTAPTPPVACATYTPPTAPTFTATTPITINSQKTFTAGNYYYTTFSTAWTDICFDVSAGDINIFVSGDASSNATIYVKTSTNGNCFNNSNKMDSIDETFYTSAAKIFLYTGGKFTLGGGVDWFGTVLASGSIYPAGGSSIIGSLHSINGTVNPDGSWYEIKYVESNYLSNH